MTAKWNRVMRDVAETGDSGAADADGLRSAAAHTSEILERGPLQLS